MRTLKISTYLAADLETVKSYLMTPATQLCGGWFNEIYPIEPNFSVKMGWGKFSAKMFAFHFLPIGKQCRYRISQKSDHGFRDNGSGS